MNINNLPPDDRKVVFAGAFVFLLSLILAAALGGVIPGLPGVLNNNGGGAQTEKGDYTDSGQATENSETTFSVSPANGTVVSIQASVSWTDEADAGPRFTNMPDEFSVSIKTPSGEVVDGELSSSGSASVKFDVPSSQAEEARENGTAQTWMIIVKCGNCGDQTPMLSIAGFRARADTGNAFELSVSYSVAPFEGDE